MVGSTLEGKLTFNISAPLGMPWSRTSLTISAATLAPRLKSGWLYSSAKIDSSLTCIEKAMAGMPASAAAMAAATVPEASTSWNVLLSPMFIPEATKSGSLGRSLLTPIITQSPGVPDTA